MKIKCEECGEVFDRKTDAVQHLLDAYEDAECSMYMSIEQLKKLGVNVNNPHK